MLLTWATVLSILGVLFNPSPLDRSRIPAMRELARDPVIAEGLWDMFRRAQYGFSHLEQAAFVVVDPDGTLSLVPWPMTAIDDESHWKGPLPPNAIAIVHTHPNTSPRPSRIDARTAIETGLAVYVVTRNMIQKTSHGITEVVVTGPWRQGKHRIPALANARTGADSLKSMR